MTVLHLLIFCDFDPTEAYRSVVLQMAPQFGFFWCFLMIGLKLYFFGKNIRCVPHPFIFRGYMLLLCPLTGDVNLDWLVKVMSAGCPSNVKSFFPLQWMNLGGDTLGVGKYPFLLNVSLVISASTSGYKLQQLLLWYFNDDFIFASFLHLLFFSTDASPSFFLPLFPPTPTPGPPFLPSFSLLFLLSFPVDYSY